MNKEIKWKPVEGYEGFYVISNTGIVKGITRLLICKDGKNKILKERTIKPQISKYGYKRLILHKNKINLNKSIHRLVATAFIHNPLNLPQVNHKDGNKLNNHVDNLEWCTQLENIRHAFCNGLIVAKKGQESHMSKLSDEQKKEIFYLSKKGVKTKVLAVENNVNERTIRRIIEKLRLYK